MKLQVSAVLITEINMSKKGSCQSYFFGPPLYAVVTLGNQLLVKKAVEKMNLRKKSDVSR